ncbi:homocitrate synthase/isopropylmalate synthase family protein [Desulfovibrio inopinatus]|uniref:homocitrate synthase/isopropylmalate synthase family protein n=1 Tax=Desulfovibrio inopinatus TaxID=102109 RepID=UPI0003F698D4|nr:hypothetical protein [Desulfovibrio inopinatus]
MLIDSTLREGEQRFGLYLDSRLKSDIVKNLLVFGVEEIECGVIGRHSGLRDLIRSIRSISGKTRLSLWSPCRGDMLAEAAETSCDQLNIGVPVSDEHIEKRLHLDRERLLAMVDKNVRFAKTHTDAAISVGLEDVSRAERSFAISVAHCAKAAGATRIRLSDTVGILHPLAMGAMVTDFQQETGMLIAVHCHNDFGMATANAVAALVAGADFADVSVLGLGERAGIAALEEVGAYAAMQLGEKYDVSVLPGLCQLVAQATGHPLPPNKPVVGNMLFACESGLHVHGVFKDPSLYEPFSPDTVGLVRQTALGKKSGRAAVSAVFAALGRPVPAEMINDITEVVRKRSRELGRPLHDEEILDLADSFGHR